MTEIKDHGSNRRRLPMCPLYIQEWIPWKRMLFLKYFLMFTILVTSSEIADAMHKTFFNSLRRDTIKRRYIVLSTNTIEKRLQHSFQQRIPIIYHSVTYNLTTVRDTNSLNPLQEYTQYLATITTKYTWPKHEKSYKHVFMNTYKPA